MDKKSVELIAGLTNRCVRNAEGTGKPVYMKPSDEGDYCGLVDYLNARDLIECGLGCGCLDPNQLIRDVNNGVIRPTCTYKTQQNKVEGEGKNERING